MRSCPRASARASVRGLAESQNGGFRHERPNHYVSALLHGDKAYRISAEPMMPTASEQYEEEIAQREANVARRESMIATQRTELARAVDAIEH